MSLYSRKKFVNLQQVIIFINSFKLFRIINIFSKLSGLITCEATQKMDEVNSKFDMFGVELVDGQSFLLHPKDFTDSNFADNKFRNKDGSISSFKIFKNSDANAKGILIKDSVCFDRLLDFFVTLPKPIISNSRANNEQKQINVNGIILPF